jgi:cytochrome c5
MKRFALITAVMLGLLSVAAIAACGGGGGSTPTASSAPTQTAAPTESATPSPTPSSSASAALTGEQLVAERCDACHGSPDRIASKQWTKAEWTQEVDDMIAEQGAQLTAEEKTIVIDYLTATYGP